jgi:hypothetical protein
MSTRSYPHTFHNQTRTTTTENSGLPKQKLPEWLNDNGGYYPNLSTLHIYPERSYHNNMRGF